MQKFGIVDRECLHVVRKFLNYALARKNDAKFFQSSMNYQRNEKKFGNMPLRVNA